MAAVLACGPGAVLSHRSAAALLELMASGGVDIDVTVPHRSRRKHSGIDLRAIDDQLARNLTRPGAKAVRRVLNEHYIGKTPTWSENEEALLAITRPLGIPDPDTNQFIVLDDGGPAIRVDFVWRDQRVIVEADSKKWHNTRQRFEQDRVRDQRLTAAGWTIIRTTWRQMTQRPHELRPLLLKLLAPGSRAAHG